VLQGVAGCCSALQCVAVCCSVDVHLFQLNVVDRQFHLCVAVCCSVLQCVAVCRGVLQFVAALMCICS